MSGAALLVLRAAALLVAVGLAVTLSGCGLFGGEPKAVRPGWDKLTAVAASDANGNSALAVDVVLVRDKVVLEKLQALPSASYFATRTDLQRAYPDGLTVMPLEITPGQKVGFDRKRFGAERVWAALVFANYATPGDHRASLLLDNEGYVLELNAQEFVARDTKTGTAR